MNAEELNERVAIIEQQYEDLEQNYYLHICALIGVIFHLLWGNWLISIASPLLIYALSWKYLAKKPFTSKIGANQ